MPVRDDAPLESLTIVLAQQGDSAAFALLVEWYDRRLLYFVRRILGDGDGAFDVLQTVWLTVHRKLRTLQSPDAFRVWVYRIAHDLAVTELRRRSRRPVLFEEIDPPPAAEEAGPEPAFENAELVHAALADLTVDHRRVLTLRFLEDMPIEEIASVVGCQAGTVKSRLHYAKQALRRRIEELLHGSESRPAAIRLATPRAGRDPE